LCGIAGFTHKSSESSSDRIHQAAHLLFHRGPDQQAVFESRCVALAAARLKIIDLKSGDQPMTDENGDTTVIFNGEIYNFGEIRQKLEQLGHRFKTNCDTETVLKAFIQWDVECFSWLRGMFAVALWTESQKRLVLARDRVGIKPLYFTTRNGEIYFGSELKTLFVHPEVERRLDLASLDSYLSLNYVPGPRCFVEGVEKLRPGHWLEWRDGKISNAHYWLLPPQISSRMSIEQASLELDGLLSKSIREHLLADVPSSVWLSGGIDSSTALHYAAQASSSRVKTFSITFRGYSFDESACVRQLADHYGTDHEELDLNPSLDLESAIEEFPRYADEPVADAGGLPLWFLSRMTKRSATVALSGEGADELFGGYVTYRANTLARYARLAPRIILKLGSRVLKAWPASDEKISLEYKLKRFLDGCRMRPERAHVYWNGTFSDEEKLRLVKRKLPDALQQLLSELADAGDNVPAYLRFDQRYYLPDDILAKVDRISMAHSVEVRPPFLDHRIVEFAATLPSELKIRGSGQKVLLRHMMKGRLPANILHRPKIGFDIPAHEWLRGPLRNLMRDALDYGLSQHGELFSGDQIKFYVDQHLSRRANYGYHLWGLMILFLWMRTWRIQTAGISDTSQVSLNAITS
jgi:asparagine synthase (glutamine-hydrolysing)